MIPHFNKNMVVHSILPLKLYSKEDPQLNIWIY